MKLTFKGTFLFVALFSLISCDKDDDGPNIPQYTIPDSYSFDNVNFEDATARVKMLDNINKYLSTAQANMDKVTLDQTKLDNMWVNSGNAFDTAWLNTTGVSLAEITADAATFKGYIDALAALSAQDLTPAADGTAGYIARNAGKILVSGEGLEYVQAVQKGTMGAALFKEGIALLDEVLASDNNTVVPGEGTEMAHNFDLAYGYFSIPTNYDTTTEFATNNRSKLLFWGNYIRERGGYINAADVIWKAFRTGRAAIEAKDMSTVNSQVGIIKEYWEKVAAAAAWAYVTIPQSQSGNLSSQLHALSEGFGFISALKYRPSTSPLTASQYNQLIEILGPGTNFYDLLSDPSFTQLNAAKAILNTAYGQLQEN
ncbi:MAG: DUF4856 domain-containing protein [Chitinophagaceae bacterium]|nr:DUF4856 domain-containing protein [Chitinophagaceae bacterium]